MLSLSHEQLHAAIAQLDQAIYSHEQWYKNLVRTLIVRLPPEAPDMEGDAYSRCRFGQWYDSGSSGALRGHAAFVELGQAHRKMHECATDLLQRSAYGLPIAAAELDQFNNVLDRMRLEIQSLRGELMEMVQNRDALTGARNRLTLLTDLREQQALVRRGLQQCALVVFDLDHFKAVNDNYGHAAGDAVLTAIVRGVQEDVRPYDRLYRYGGEEFLLCMPNTAEHTAAAMAERLRHRIAELRIPRANGAPVLSVTASFGVSMLDASLPVEESIDRADQAFYRAKRNGRNRVETWTEAPSA